MSNKMDRPLVTVDGRTLMDRPLEPPNFVVDTLISQGLHILAGSPKVGKSWLALWLAVTVAKGEPVWGMSVKQGTTLYLCLEAVSYTHLSGSGTATGTSAATSSGRSWKRRVCAWPVRRRTGIWWRSWSCRSTRGMWGASSIRSLRAVPTGPILCSRGSWPRHWNIRRSKKDGRCEGRLLIRTS